VLYEDYAKGKSDTSKLPKLPEPRRAAAPPGEVLKKEDVDEVYGKLVKSKAGDAAAQKKAEGGKKKRPVVPAEQVPIVFEVRDTRRDNAGGFRGGRRGGRGDGGRGDGGPRRYGNAGGGGRGRRIQFDNDNFPSLSPNSGAANDAQGQGQGQQQTQQSQPAGTRTEQTAS